MQSAFRRALAAVSLFLLLFCPVLSARAAAPTATPEPLQISKSVADPPDVIQALIDVAVSEWESVGGKRLPKSNKYTQIFNPDEWGWCAGFTSWCAFRADVPRASRNEIMKMPEGESEPVFTSFTTSPGKYLVCFQHMRRTTMIPQKGYWILYGDRTNYCVHIGLVCDVRGPNDTETIDTAKEIVAETGVTYLNLLPFSEMNWVFPAMYIPTTYFVDEKGQIIGEEAVGARGADDYEALVDELLEGM